jgi:hypothetical protein
MRVAPLHEFFDALRVRLRFFRQFLIDARLACAIGAGRVDLEKLRDMKNSGRCSHPPLQSIMAIKRQKRR